MKALNAFLRVEGLDDDEARALPTRLDEVSLARMDISTWRTDAGDLDILTAIPTRDGGRAFYDDLARRATRVQVAGSRYGSHRCQTSSLRRSGPTARRIGLRCPSFDVSPTTPPAKPRSTDRLRCRRWCWVCRGGVVDRAVQGVGGTR